MARSWTGNLFFTPLAADIGPGPEGAAGGASSWTGSLLSTPPSLAGVSANFGPGPEAAVEGRTAGRRICFVPLSPPTLELARRAAGGRAVPRTGSWRGICFYATDFGPGPEGVGEGCAALAWSLPFYLSLTGLDWRPSDARSLVPTPSKTVDQTLPP